MTEKEELNQILREHPELLEPALILLEVLNNACAVRGAADHTDR